VYRALGLKLVDSKAFAVLEQMVEVAAVGLQIRGIEHRPENALHIHALLEIW
jgi:hypothetical protein